MLEAVRRWRDELADTYVLGAVRVALGLVLLGNALRAARELEDGFFGDVFHWPILPEYAVPSRAIYTVLVALQVLLPVLVVIGARARAALFLSALIVLYALLCDRLHYHNNRAALAFYALLLSLAPCDRSHSLVGPAPATRVGPMWAARLAQAQVSIIYLASGGSKLLDGDWRTGRVIHVRFLLYGQHTIDSGVPASVVAWFTQPEVCDGLAKLAIATELLLAVGLFWRPTRVVALWWGTWFHLTIEASSRVEGFTWLTLAMYTLFATPDVKARALHYDGQRARGRAIARAVRALDWLARFDVNPWAPDGIRRGHAVVVIRRDGTPATGVRALAMVARCVPLLFPLWVPLALVASFTKGGDAPDRA